MACIKDECPNWIMESCDLYFPSECPHVQINVEEGNKNCNTEVDCKDCYFQCEDPPTKEEGDANEL